MFNFELLSTIVALSLGLSTSAAVVNKELHIVNAQLAPDGFTRTTTVANGIIPGPLITGFKGDNFKINVIDELTNSSLHRATSIHWHGLFQKGTAEMDGPAFVTQCPIVPDHSFLYDFSVPDESGTFWYHSHLSTQYCDGLRGAFVIYDENDPHKGRYDIDDESTVITLADWYHGLSTDLFNEVNRAVPRPDSTLINGKGRSPQNLTAPLAVVTVQPNKKHRLRIVSTSCNPNFVFSIDGHDLEVIEADGVLTQNVTVKALTVFAGQRYSVVLHANQQAGNYWIRARPNTAADTSFNNGLNSAILRYTNASDVEPTTTPTTTPLLTEADLHPLINPGAPGVPTSDGADVTIPITFAFNGSSWNIVWNNTNANSYQSPPLPVLLHILNGTTDPSQLMPRGSIVPLPRNKTIQLDITSGGAHPFHLHGHTFDVVKVPGSNVFNFENPVRRDVIATPASIRFTTDNPGPWFLHCHIDWHLEGGLALIFAEDIEHIAEANPPNLAWNELCPLYEELNPDEGHSN